MAWMPAHRRPRLLAAGGAVPNRNGKTIMNEAGTGLAVRLVRIIEVLGQAPVGGVDGASVAAQCGGGVEAVQRDLAVLIGARYVSLSRKRKLTGEGWRMANHYQLTAFGVARSPRVLRGVVPRVTLTRAVRELLTVLLAAAESGGPGYVTVAQLAVEPRVNKSAVYDRLRRVPRAQWVQWERYTMPGASTPVKRYRLAGAWVALVRTLLGDPDASQSSGPRGDSGSAAGG
jgi:hypothetical protein